MIKAAIKIFTETSSTFMWTYQSQKKTSPVSHSSKKAKKKHHNITRLRYCLYPLSPTNLFQIQILFLSAGVNTAGTVGDIYFSIHDDIRPFHLPLHLKKMFLIHFYFLTKETIIFLQRYHSGESLD